jgi:hypothetical protein
MTTFEQKENHGRETFSLFCEQQSWCRVKNYAKDKYSHWDVAYTSGSTLMIGEIKVRSEYESNTYAEWYLEVDKYENLLKIQQKTAKNTTITYINHFKDNITLIWDLNSLDLSKLNKVVRKLPKNNESDEEIMKVVYMLPRYLAIKNETNLNKSIFN